MNLHGWTHDCRSCGRRWNGITYKLASGYLASYFRCPCKTKSHG